MKLHGKRVVGIASKGCRAGTSGISEGIPAICEAQPALARRGLMKSLGRNGSIPFLSNLIYQYVRLKLSR